MRSHHLLNLLLLFPFLSLTTPSLLPRRPQPKSYDTHSYYTLDLHPSSSLTQAKTISSSLGVELIEPLGELPGHWIVRTPGETPSHLTPRSIQDPIIKRWHSLRSNSNQSKSHLRSLTPLHLKQRAKRTFPHENGLQLLDKRRENVRQDEAELWYAQNELHLQDPMLHQQWHLINTQMPDIELNVTGLWGKGVTGNDVKVVIVDDGLDMESDDLKDNFYPEGSYDFNDHTDLPVPRLSDDQHGTRCAGEIAAVPNDVCGVGVAYTSKIAGVRILSAPISDADEAAALNYAYQLNEIYSCSWGPPDDGKSMEAPEGIILKALVNGVQNGRNGKGSLFVFAAGNGGGMDDQCNFDGYTNSIFSITVGAVDRKGLHPYYSELCSAMMMVAPSSGSGDHIHTTDVGKDKCAHTHGGTSAAAPLAAGVLALTLSVRPDLSWRDFQHIAVRNSVFFNPDDPDWEKTAAGRMFSYKYAGRFVAAAESWTLVKPQAWFDSPAVYLPTTELNSTSSRHRKRQTSSTIRLSKRQDDSPEDTTEPEETDGGDIEDEPVLEIEPSGSVLSTDDVVSTFSVTQAMLDDSNFERLEHVTVRVWIDHSRRGDVEVELESPNGVKSVLARKRRFDEADTGFPGWKFMTLKHWDENPIGTWTIRVHDQGYADRTGRFIAWSLQLWGECVDPSLARLWAPAEEGEADEEETGSEEATATLSQKPKPTEHLPGDHGEASGEADKPGLASPTPVPGEDITPPSDEEEHLDEGWFSGIESLGRSSTWIAGAGMIIILLGSGVGMFFFFRSRRRKNLFGLANDGEGARGVYVPVGEDVPMGLLGRLRKKGKGTKELYDAFGDEESEEDEDEEEDERTRLRYHDDFLGDDDPPRMEGYSDEPDSKVVERDQGGKREGNGGSVGSGGGGGSGISGDGGRSGSEESKGKRESGSVSSSSWQDAAEERAV
ncbi:kexin [Tremella mesenterica]|uniref:Kexin n=1 Tax=Tremella mesenterica TaxID=5217 RepID=A0A4Q1BP45_TREME|nr:uncharacterized protein TREMEDRAFT_70081 [Tremella mesenterica DSM 1558]EIW66475.1 hypothetical protein TREMEDRAFT_70081 [Tremella mesenterica DSM 1558]RXK39656.1 kexin [Tremella mesenterica]